jgi:hypothetical protein
MSNGDVTPRPQGEDRKSGRIEAETKFILQQIENGLHAGGSTGRRTTTTATRRPSAY